MNMGDKWPNGLLCSARAAFAACVLPIPEMLFSHSFRIILTKKMSSECYLYRGSDRRGKRQDADIALLAGIPYEKNVGTEFQDLRRRQSADAGP
jgi:hypothetical protein